MGRCGCSSVDTCGCRFASSDSIDITGLGTPSSPFVLALASGNLQTVVCDSATRPPSPAVGQPIYETDTALARWWDGTWWRPLGQEQQFEHEFSVEGFTTVAITTVYDPGSFAGVIDYPFRMTVEGAITAGFTNTDGSIVHVYLDSPSGTGIWKPSGLTGVVQFDQRLSKWEHAYIRGYRDYPAGGTPNYVVRADSPSGASTFLRGSISARIIPT